MARKTTAARPGAPTTAATMDAGAQLCVGIIPVGAMLDLKALAAALGGKRADLLAVTAGRYGEITRR